MIFRTIGPVVFLVIAAGVLFPGETSACSRGSEIKLLPDPKPPTAAALKSFDQAQKLEHSGQVRGAIADYRRSAAAGYGPAAKALGDIYDRGRGVPRDFQESYEWYYRAQELGTWAGLHCSHVRKQDLPR